MPKLIVLGTSNAIPHRDHDNTHLAVIGEKTFILIDTASNPTVRLPQAGLDPLKLNRLILTHFHPDHTAGVPSLFMNSWLSGRTDALDVYGLEDTLQRVEKTMQLYEWESWPNFFPVDFHRLPAEEKALAFDSVDFRVSVSPVRHMIPVIGVRIESRSTGKVVVYSSDTEPCPEIVRLAAGADLLLHEASGAGYGHSSAAQAGEAARQAGVGALFLIHYPSGDFDPASLVEQARESFCGPVTLCRDLMELDF